MIFFFPLSFSQTDWLHVVRFYPHVYKINQSSYLWHLFILTWRCVYYPDEARIKKKPAPKSPTKQGDKIFLIQHTSLNETHAKCKAAYWRVECNKQPSACSMFRYSRVEFNATPHSFPPVQVLLPRFSSSPGISRSEQERRWSYCVILEALYPLIATGSSSKNRWE